MEETTKNIEQKAEDIIKPTPISPIKEIVNEIEIPATELTPTVSTNSVNLLKNYLMLILLKNLIC